MCARRIDAGIMFVEIKECLSIPPYTFNSNWNGELQRSSH